MKISLNWLKRLVNIKIDDDELIRLIGARLVEVEGVIDETNKYDKIFVAKVVHAEKIPDTHLTLCQIDVGGVELPKVEKNPEGLVQVVCGALNVKEGMFVVWIAPGAVVPASVHEDSPFVIGKRKMLGKYESSGMLAGADELDFGDDHSGIVELDPDNVFPGQEFAEVFELKDKILEIENKSLTHRPDAFGMIGFAREVAGILGEKFEEDSNLILTQKKQISNLRSLSVKIDDASICQRYTAVLLEKHGEIKQKYLTWQDTILTKSGMRPVDAIVDVTNYLMLLTGQPLHAFDYDKFVMVGGGESAKIVVRLARTGEELTLIDGKTVELSENDIVICSGDVPVALAGAMGGASTEIDANTRNVIIESATFSLYNLRKTQMEHGIFTEAITRFTKGQPPYQTLAVAELCADLLAGGFKETGVFDMYPMPLKDVVVEVTVDEINGLLGTSYDAAVIVRTLENVGFLVKNKHGMLKIVVPKWRNDIHIKEDIIEEIGRLNGYDNIVPVLPKHGTAELNPELVLKNQIRGLMKRFGANEVLTYSFVSERLMKKAGINCDNSYKIINSISPDLQMIRQSLVSSLLEKAYMNQKIPVEKFMIFEINKVYQKEWGMNLEGVPEEKTYFAGVVAERKGTGTAFYLAKKYLDEVFYELNLQVEYVPLMGDAPEKRPFEEKRAANVMLDGVCIGVVGEFKNSVRRNFKLVEFLAGFELDFSEICERCGSTRKIDAFVVESKEDVTVTTQDSYAVALAKVKREHPGAEVTPVGIYQSDDNKKTGEKNITFHLVVKK